MAEYVLLDSAPLGSACRNPRHPVAVHCRQWIDGLLARGVLVAVPEITDFEVRRELMRVGAMASVSRLDALVTAGGLIYVPVTTADWRQAAIFWADVRRQGVPTAHPHSGLVHLKKLTKLRMLTLSDTLITDAGLVHVKKLTKLQYIGLGGTQVTDAGMAELKALTKLSTLHLGRNTQISQAGMNELKRALPRLTIIH